MLGDLDSNATWVFIGGLTDNINDPGYIKNQEILDHVAKENHIKIIAITPTHRCDNFDNRLCWPFATNDDVKTTYSEILAQIDTEKVDGYIGFSNGSFFLNKLATIRILQAPIISIGGGGNVTSEAKRNNVYLIIGTADQDHYPSAINYYNQAQDTSLHVVLIKHDGGHIIPEQTLLELVTKISKAYSPQL